ncbi:MAG TPA: suppressor of fused domain protein [Gaiellaceae bacterium]
MSDERSPGGSRIIRHEAPSGDAPSTSGDPDLIAAIDAHLDACFGKADRSVFHEVVSTSIHIDVHLVPPSDEFPVQRLVTSGMSEAPMTVPEGFDDTPFAELTIALPPDWPMSDRAFSDERVYWPIRLLKSLARLPHQYSTFLTHGHTIPNGDPPRRYTRGTSLCCALIVPPLFSPEEFTTLELTGERIVRFLAIVPIHEDELRLKLDQGSDALYELFNAQNVSDVVDPDRPSVVPGQRRSR